MVDNSFFIHILLFFFVKFKLAVVVLFLVDRLQNIFEEYGCDACTDNGSQDIDPEPPAHAIGKSSITPSCKVSHQSGTEVAGGAGFKWA